MQIPRLQSLQQFWPATLSILVLTCLVIGFASETFGQTPLFEAVQNNDLERVKKYIADGWDVNAVPAGEQSLLLRARDAEITRVLIQAGLDVKSNKQAETAIFAAAQYGNAAQLKILLDAGCDPNLINPQSRSTLILAAQDSTSEIIKLLVENGADLNTQDDYGHTALSWAAWTGKPECVEQLIGSGADIELADSRGRTPLYFASMRSAEKVRLLLKAGADPTKVGWTPLAQAIVNQDVDALRKELTSNPSDLEKRDIASRTPLMLASFLGDANCIEVLCLAGADLTATQKDGRAPLHFASLFGTEEHAKALLVAGAKPDTQDRKGATPLILSVARNPNNSLIQTLIAHGADVNDPGGTKTAPLFISLGYISVYGNSSGNAEVAKTLLDAGADVNHVHKTEFMEVTNLMQAAEHSSAEVISLLIQAGADVNATGKYGKTALHNAATRNPEIVERLVENGAVVDARDEYGETPLFCAVKYGTAESVQALLDAGANIDSTTDRGVPVLFAACRNPKIVSLLIENGVNLKPTQSDNSTAIFSSIRSGSYFSLEILLEAGCDVNAQLQSGKTALMTAVASGKIYEAKLLLQKGAKTELQDRDGQTVFDLVEQISDESIRNEFQKMLRDQ